jgi:antitoxin (DNA-binding transcriptional repressor) of toxin-antitoxin stability system
MKKLELRDLLEAHELTERINEILRLIEEEGETIELTDHGKTIAHVVPQETQSPQSQDQRGYWKEMDELAAKIGASWQDDMDAVEAVRDVRRDL